MDLTTAPRHILQLALDLHKKEDELAELVYEFKTTRVCMEEWMKLCACINEKRARIEQIKNVLQEESDYYRRIIEHLQA